MTFDYDLFVIGGGSGGVRAARVAAEGGASVALAEESRMGGTCVIRGCVPKKLMVFASTAARQVSEARAYGWDVKDGGFDWKGTFHPMLQAELDRLESIYRTNLDKAGVEIFDSRAVLKDAHTIAFKNGVTKTAKHILVAVGGHPYMPPETEGIELAMSSNDVFHLETLPKSILIVGGGYIACEFACIFNGLGSDVTQIYRGAQILRGFDDEIRGHLAEVIRDRDINLHVGCDVLMMEKDAGGVKVTTTDGNVAVYEKVLMATGRIPNTADMGLEEAGVKLGKRGKIIVDDYSQTSVPSIFAVGDVTDRVALTPVAIREGAAFVETVFNGNPTKVEYDRIPTAVFTQPELGTVGLTEEQAREDHDIEVYSTAFKPMQNAFIGRDERVLFKLIVERKTRQVLGAHMIADGAGELVQMIGIAIKMGATKEDFDRTMAVHPTMSEEIVLMKTPVRVA